MIIAIVIYLLLPLISKVGNIMALLYNSAMRIIRLSIGYTFSAYDVPGTILSNLHTVTHLILTTTL